MDDLRLTPYESDHGPAVVSLWNRAIGNSYPLQERLLRQNVDENPNFRPGDAILAWRGNALVGFALLQRYRGDEPDCQGWKNTGWLAAVVVDPALQRRGIGTRMVAALLDQAEGIAREAVQPGGGIFWFIPGVPEDLPAARPFCESLGFQFGRTVYDIRADLSAFVLPERSTGLLTDHGLAARPCTVDETDRLLNFILTEFGGNWWYNAKTFFDAGGTPADWLLLLRDDAIVGMARLHHPGQAVIGAPRYWLHGPDAGGLGPIGIAASLRGLGLGLALLHSTLAHLRERGVTDAVADWTDLLNFYAKAGFTPWKGYAESARAGR